MIKLSKTSKLGTFSWSLEAGTTCPGSHNASVCTGCYAKQGNYRFPNVKAPREFNRTDWKRDEWVDDMVQALKRQTHFRWFDSGDIYKPALAQKILEVAQRTPNTRHWIPTQTWDIAKFKPILDALAALPNVVLRASAKDVNQPVKRELWANSSMVVDRPESAPDYAVVCEAYTRDGKCGTCRTCYDKTVPLIAYPQHGRAMAKHIRLTVVN